MIVDKEWVIFAGGGLGSAILILLALIAKGFMAYIKEVQSGQDQDIARVENYLRDELKTMNNKLDNLLVHSAQHVTIKQHNEDITEIYKEIRRVHGVSQGNK